MPGHTERRLIRSEDPSLSPETNAWLTEELRAVLGCDEVVVDVDTTDALHARHGGHRAFVPLFAENRVAFGSGFAALIVFGAIVALATGSWWVLGVAVLLDILGVLAVGGLILEITSETEHVSGALAVRLEDEGVADPDRLFTELVEDYRTKA